MTWLDAQDGHHLIPLEFVFQEQSNSSLHSGWSLAWDTFAAILTIPVAPSPISAELSPIPVALSRSLRRSATAGSPITERLAKHHKTLLNKIKHHETHVKHCDTSLTSKTILKHCETS